MRTIGADAPSQGGILCARARITPGAFVRHVALDIEHFDTVFVINHFENLDFLEHEICRFLLKAGQIHDLQSDLVARLQIYGRADFTIGPNPNDTANIESGHVLTHQTGEVKPPPVLFLMESFLLRFNVLRLGLFIQIF